MKGQQEKVESDINMSLVKDKSDRMRIIVGDVTVCRSRNVEAPWLSACKTNPCLAGAQASTGTCVP